MTQPQARIQEIEKELDLVFWDLLIPLRGEKRIDPDLFGKFCSCLDELIDLVLGDPAAKKRVVGFLYLVYEVFLAEAKLAPEPDLIRAEARKLQDRLERLWDKI